MKTIIFSLILLFSALQMNATIQDGGEKKAKTETATIHTSGNCGECKSIIEAALSKTKGVKKGSFDLEKKEVTVVFKPKKTDINQIRKAITMAGYDADDLKADQEAYDNLPKCCKVGGMDD